ncbi:histidine--tRNA ligase [Bifidobacterium sp. ESL0790]|uniref:histidine--tRNA ligase n=1 Tax=Bifidobacterium sp. ESL0790 TaxID=2983233 RepID=UPI0023F9E1CE|nr:histidine--tRNA ligase [Bifidobacterium sp. ESL0790]WEV71848.1 histidine--tRNA ligase [Bifidobacterium sp. ESL0790]
MAKGASISGFPEWLPSERVVEQRVIDTVRKVFELNGFIGIETRAVEEGSSLLKKGETSKEIYLLSRLQEVGHESDTPIEQRLGLHFDLTVPLSRYVVEHSGQLTFPFKRWQIQKVWRGERPQEGRFREFVQADIDVIGNGELEDHYEVELPLVMVQALEELRRFGLPKATVHANNRKLSEGFYRGLGLTDVEGVLREIDKLDKIGGDEVVKLLVSECGASEAQARACLELAELTAANGDELHQKFDELCAKHGIGTDSDAYKFAIEGLDTLAMIVDEAAAIRPGSVIADLKIARGLDYYTGSVYETFLEGAESLGSICSGGRYDNLASQGNRKYPGVGLSIGLSRLVSYMLHTAGAHASRVSPASVMVAVWNEGDRLASNHIASQLRARGIAADVAPKATKLGKQIHYADRLGIPYVWFPADAAGDGEGSARDEVKNIVTGEQVAADATSWRPDSVYAQQTVNLDA